MPRETRTFTKKEGRQSFDSEAYTEDGGKTWRWVSNGRPCPLDACNDYDIPCDHTAQRLAVEESTRAALASYRESMANHVPGPEELFEMRAAFGRGATVVNVVTGQRTRL